MLYNILDDTCDKISQPNNMTIQLMEHQKTVVFAMRKLEQTGKLNANNISDYGGKMNFDIDTTLGILSDKVGSGKSLMIVALINNEKIVKEREIYWSGSRFVAIVSTTENKAVPINLLIIPHKLLTQWVNFFNYAPDLNVKLYSSSEDEQNINSINDLNNVDVVILSCTKSVSFFSKFSNIKWSRVIIDEADTINLSSNTIFNGSFIWLVTATPRVLRYSKKNYLIKIFKNIVPWTFDYLLVKNNLEFIEKSIVLPTPKRIKIKCLTPNEIQIIQHFIPKNVLSMINAGNTKEAIKMLNCNVDTSENIMKVITNNLLEAINNKKLELECEVKKVYHNQKSKDEQELKIKKYKICIERLQTRYDSIKDKIYNLNDQYCPICMDEFTNPTLVNCCQNVFCFECLTLATEKNHTCPYCKKKIVKENIHVISTKDKNNKKVMKETRDKLVELTELLENNPTGKFLVFANYQQTFDKIKVELNNKNISYKILKGTGTQVQKSIDDFKDGNIQVIMLNAKFFGAGMNLQMATHIVIYHRFDSDLEEQVIGRAQRLGRTDTLNVIYLLHDNESDSFNSNNKFDDIDYDDWIEHIINEDEIKHEPVNESANKTTLLVEQDDKNDQLHAETENKITKVVEQDDNNNQLHSEAENKITKVVEQEDKNDQLHAETENKTTLLVKQENNKENYKLNDHTYLKIKNIQRKKISIPGKDLKINRKATKKNIIVV
jgi:hypothetical protein